MVGLTYNGHTDPRFVPRFHFGKLPSDQTIVNGIRIDNFPFHSVSFSGCSRFSRPDPRNSGNARWSEVARLER
jgi:hypothetical protein